MFKNLIVLVLFLLSISAFSQDSILIGKKYKEDQIYLRLTYNILLHKPKTIIQKGLSLGIHTGFIKDISLSENGKLALGVGLGYAYDKHQSNLFIDATESNFSLIEMDYKKNKFETHAIELPIELRFRTSTDTNYKFWRIYVGGKLAYNFAAKSVYKDENQQLKVSPLHTISKWQYGPQLSVGYSTWNLYMYWDAGSIFKEAPQIDTFDPNALTSLKVGLQFYIF
jgi:hypothetical protein